MDTRSSSGNSYSRPGDATGVDRRYRIRAIAAIISAFLVNVPGRLDDLFPGLEGIDNSRLYASFPFGT